MEDGDKVRYPEAAMSLAAVDFATIVPVGQFAAVAAFERARDRPKRRGVRRPKSARPRYDRLLSVVQKIGEPILKAAGEHDLHARLEQAATDPSLAQAAQLLASKIDLQSVLSSQFEPVVTELEPQIGRQAALALERGMRNELAALAAVMNLMAKLTDEQREVGRAVFEDHRRILYEPTIPLTISETMLAAFKGQAAMYGVLFALFSEQPIDREVVTELATIYERGMHGYARLLASEPGAGISEEIVPRSEWYDLKELQRRHDEYWHRVSSSEVSFGAPDDD